MFARRHIPLALTLFRIALAPVVIALAWRMPDRLAFGVCLTCALLSDVFDGIIARRLHVATANLRRLDSIADTIFYLSAAAAIWHLDPGAIRRNIGLIAVLLSLELFRYALDFARFGREASYHMWSSKAWGLLLFAAVLSILSFEDGGLPLTIAIAAGIVCDIEGIAISFILPVWTHDVPSVVHAVRIRAALRRDGTAGGD